ncbi:hypothetical protein ACNKHQ_23355 [Shigella flexneri]
MSYDSAPQFLAAGCVVFDLSGAFRVNDALFYEKYYRLYPSASSAAGAGGVRPGQRSAEALKRGEPDCGAGLLPDGGAAFSETL